jgi:hypothetical protein
VQRKIHAQPLIYEIINDDNIIGMAIFMSQQSRT